MTYINGIMVMFDTSHFTMRQLSFIAGQGKTYKYTTRTCLNHGCRTFHC